MDALTAAGAALRHIAWTPRLPPAALPSFRTPSSGHSVPTNPTAPGHRFHVRLVGACLDSRLPV